MVYLSLNLNYLYAETPKAYVSYTKHGYVYSTVNYNPLPPPTLLPIITAMLFFYRKGIGDKGGVLDAP